VVQRYSSQPVPAADWTSTSRSVGSGGQPLAHLLDVNDVIAPIPFEAAAGDPGSDRPGPVHADVPGRGGVVMESRYRTLKKFPWARTFHGESSQRAKDGFCTVTGVCERRARWSIWAKSPDDECWLAACDEHVLPMADDD
jgi:hypothetical protein